MYVITSKFPPWPFLSSKNNARHHILNAAALDDLLKQICVDEANIEVGEEAGGQFLGRHFRPKYFCVCICVCISVFVCVCICVKGLIV